MGSVREYYQLTKPGIIRGNLLVATAAYLFGSKNQIELSVLFGLLVGTSSIIAAGCIVNNYFDRHIDQHMSRTSKRALATGSISPIHALLFAAVLGLIGVTSLALFVNFATLAVGVVGFITYAFIYTFAKHKTVHATLIGTLPGATPPVAGYAAATGHIDNAALLLFITMVAWQMAHFYAISLFRLSEYKAANVPVFSVMKGAATTRRHIIGYIIAFTAIAPLLSVFNYASITYGVTMFGIGLYWLYVATQDASDPNAWAKKIFGASLFILLIFSAVLALNIYLL